MSYRVILYHKHPTSARTQFLKYNYNSVCALEKLPVLAQIVEYLPNSIVHPASVLSQLEKELDFPKGMLKAEGGYLQNVEVPGELIQIILASIISMDPPFEVAEKIDARFIDLTQARGLPQVELELLRHAYELVLGG